MAIVQTQIPTTSRVCEEAIAALAAEYPFIRTQTLTYTAFGRPVQALALGEGERKVLYAGAFHANEWITAPLLLRFGEELAQAYREDGRLYGVKARNIWKAATVYLVPMVDPDGVDLVTGAIPPGTLPYRLAQQIGERFPDIPFPSGWKANLLGVDLNLQYPAGWLKAREIKFSQGYTQNAPRDYVGRAPLDQKESLAMAQYTEALNPDLVLALHTQGQVIFWQYQDYQVPGARRLAEEFSRLSGYALEDTPYNSSFAGYKDWFIQSFRRPGFTLECGLGENPLPLSQLEQIYRDILGILVTAATGLRESSAP